MQQLRLAKREKKKDTRSTKIRQINFSRVKATPIENLLIDLMDEVKRLLDENQKLRIN